MATRLEQFSELCALWNFIPERSILCFAALQVRPDRLNSLALLGQKHCVLLSNALR
ncbi:hypothetical protein D3875_19800 [Deinococcus cavernae]|uniref:Uncharacterized protein n=1 Tax=Deinococcus cavernae TaxID=2320857 RepID=A0A418VBC3_9DEIO|nr:hypothetical protein D3875_19800 [Deinococcus cavernae]